MGATGQVRAAVQQLQSDVDTELRTYPMDLFLPDPTAFPYRFARKNMMILGVVAQQSQVRATPHPQGLGAGGHSDVGGRSLHT